MGTKILQTDLARDALYTKVNTIADEKQDVLTFDSTPTSGSNNPVTSDGIKSALNGKENVLTFDSTPTASSSNPVTSDGIKGALDGKQNVLTFDSTPTASSSNPVTSDGIKSVLDGKVSLSADETITGTKTFSTSPVIPTPAVSSNTTVPASTAYVNNKLVKVSALPASPDSNVYYFIPE